MQKSYAKLRLSPEQFQKQLARFLMLTREDMGKSLKKKVELLKKRFDEKLTELIAVRRNLKQKNAFVKFITTYVQRADAKEVLQKDAELVERLYKNLGLEFNAEEWMHQALNHAPIAKSEAEGDAKELSPRVENLSREVKEASAALVAAVRELKGFANSQTKALFDKIEGELKLYQGLLQKSYEAIYFKFSKKAEDEDEEDNDYDDDNDDDDDYEDSIAKLIAVTKPVTINFKNASFGENRDYFVENYNYYVGRVEFRIFLRRSEGELVLRMKELEENHPHMLHGDEPCLGDIEDNVAKMLSDGDILFALQLLHKFASSYNPDDAGMDEEEMIDESKDSGNYSPEGLRLKVISELDEEGLAKHFKRAKEPDFDKLEEGDFIVAFGRGYYWENWQIYQVIEREDDKARLSGDDRHIKERGDWHSIKSLKNDFVCETEENDEDEPYQFSYVLKKGALDKLAKQYFKKKGGSEKRRVK